MASSGTGRLELTPDDAPVLCMLCTGTASGARLVATISARMNSTLAGVRSIVQSLARGGDGGEAAVNDDPTNVSAAQADAILRAPLHPFDFTSPFCFVHDGGSRAYAPSREAVVQLSDAFPRYPRLGLPSLAPNVHAAAAAAAAASTASKRGEEPATMEEAAAASVAAHTAVWLLQPPIPTVVVQYVPAPPRRSRRGADGEQLGGAGAGIGAAAAAAAAAFTGTQKRLALCVLYVAQGSGADSLRLERIMAERLALQQTAPLGISSSFTALTGAPADSSSAVLTSSSSSPSPLSGAAYGRARELQQWCAAVTRWNANVPDFLGRTLLQESAQDGSEAAVRYLLSQPYVRVNAADRQGNTALHVAVMENRGPCVRALLEGGADVLRANHAGDTALHTALLRRRASLVGLLCSRLRGSGVEPAKALRERCRNRDGQSPLDLFEQLSPSFIELCQDGSLLAVRSLVNHFLFVNSGLHARELGTQRTSLHAAAANTQHTDVLPYLVEELGLLPAKQWRELLDVRLQTPLHVAVARGNASAVALLTVACPPLLSHQDINGDTPLMLALKARRPAVAELLLTQCAPGTLDVNAYDHDGMTALHLACGQGSASVVKLLLAHHGANAASHSLRNLTVGEERLSGVHAAGGVERASTGRTRVWDGSLGDRNVTLVPATVSARVLEVARRMQRASEGRRRERANSRTASGAAGAAWPSVPAFGGAVRGYTPLLCALLYANQQFTAAEATASPRAVDGPAAASASAVRALDVVAALLPCGGVCSSDDVADAFVFFLTHDLMGLAEYLLSLDADAASSPALFSPSAEDESGGGRLVPAAPGAAAAVHEVRRSNALLCRLCEATVVQGGGARGARRVDAVRWCVEHRCCAGVNEAHAGRDGGLALVTCARVGNYAAAEYLLQSAGADPNAVSPTVAALFLESMMGSDSDVGRRSSPARQKLPSSALLLAIESGHADVAGLLIQHGALISSGDGGWSALVSAAVHGLESVVRGLLGLDALNPFDIPRALHRVMSSLHDPDAPRVCEEQARSCVASGSRPAGGHARLRRQQHWARARRICEALASHLDPTTGVGSNAGDAVHPVELLHLSASCAHHEACDGAKEGFLSVTRTLASRFLGLPTSTMMEVVLSAPAAPPGERPCKRIEPTMVPIPHPERFRRLLPHRTTGKGGLHTLRAPFDRLELPNYKAARLSGLLPPRVERRDVFSYACEAGDAALVERLRYDVGLQPWPVVDQRGCTAADYAAARGSEQLLCFFAAAGIAPRLRHDGPMRCSVARLEALTAFAPHAADAAGGDVNGAQADFRARVEAGARRRGAGLRRALHHAQEHHGNRKALLASVLSSLVEDWENARVAPLLLRGHPTEPAAAMHAARLLLDAYCRQHDVDDLRDGAAWLMPVVEACAARGRLDMLRLLVEDYRLPLGSPAASPSPSSSSPPPPRASPLLVAVWRDDVALMTYLLRAGCSPQEATLPRHDMVRVIHVRRAMDLAITPLCLAAWAGRYETIRLLVSACTASSAPADGRQRPPALTPEECVDEGGRLGDALAALVRSAPRGLSGPLEQRLAAAVRSLASVGHPFRSPLLLREAAEKQLVHTTTALVECYGVQTLVADVSDPASAGVLNSLHYMAACPALCGLLRSMLVLSQADEYGVVLHEPTEAAHTIARVAAAALLKDGDSAEEDDKGTGAERDARDAAQDERPALCPVDWALSRGCHEGAVLLLALGFTGTGCAPCVRRLPQRRAATTAGSPVRATEVGSPAAAVLLTQLQTTLRHHRRVRGTYVPGAYTVLHSAVETGQGGVIAALTAEMKLLGPVRALLDSLVPSRSAAVAPGRRPLPPSLFALAALHPLIWRRWLPSIEDVAAPCDTQLVARDVFAFILSGRGVTRALDALLRLPCNNSGANAVFTAVFSLQDPDLNSAFLARQLQQRPACFFLDGGRAMLTAFTPLTCAVAAGSLEWTQYLTAANPSALPYHRATMTLTRGPRVRRAAYAQKLARWAAGPSGTGKPQQGSTSSSRRLQTGIRTYKRPRHSRHQCALATRYGLSLRLCEEAKGRSTSMDVLVLSMALLTEAYVAGSAALVAAHTNIFQFLVGVPGAIRKENINPLALCAVSMRAWPLLERILDEAMRLQERQPSSSSSSGSGNNTDRFFFTLLSEEVPPALRRAIGPARHVMHLAAACASKEMLLRLARHSARADIEASCDARGHTCVYHALHHSHSPVMALEALVALRVPVGVPCCPRTERTPLMVAAGEGRLELVSRLLRPERLDQQDRTGHTALMLAAAHGHLPVVELLLASGAQPKLRNRAGLTAAMLAARAGFDEVAAPMAQNFSRVKDFAAAAGATTAGTTLLHCAAVGGCCRVAEIVTRAMIEQPAGSEGLMGEDQDGHTALYLAYGFGHARVLRTILAAFHQSDRQPPAGRAMAAGRQLDADAKTRLLLDSAADGGGGGRGGGVRGLGKMDRRILRCDCTLPSFGWLRAVLAIGQTLVRETVDSASAGLDEPQRAAGQPAPSPPSLRPGERWIAPRVPTFRTLPGGPSSSAAEDAVGFRARLAPQRAAHRRTPEAAMPLLRWCAAACSAVGIRALADLNIADDCGALHVAARTGHMDCVRLLVSLDMSDPSKADNETGLLPFETAAMAGHGECAEFLLQHTRAETVASVVFMSVPARLPLLDGSGDTADSSNPSSAGNRRASHSKVSRDHGRADGATALASEATRCAHGVLHRLAPACGGTLLVALVEKLLRSSTRVPMLCEKLWTLLQRPDEVGLTPFEYTIAMGDPAAVLRCAQLLQQLAEEASKADPSRFSAARGGAETASISIASTLLEYLPSLSVAVRTLLFDVFSVQGVSTAVGFDDPAATQASSLPAAGAARQTHRLTFADVRLLGINALNRVESCQPVVSSVFTIDHERLALRFLMKAFPHRIRYDPQLFCTRTLAQQRQLLQWLGTSLILSSYESSSEPGKAGVHDSTPDIATIEVKVVARRGDELDHVTGAESGSIVHALYVSSAGYLVMPDVRAALRSTRAAYRRGIQRELHALCRRATKAMRALPHPLLRTGTVAVDWDVEATVGRSADGLGAASTNVHDDRERWGSVVRRVKSALLRIHTCLTQDVADVLREVSEADLRAIAGSGGGGGESAAAATGSGPGAVVSVQYCPPSESGVTVYPSLAQLCRDSSGAGRGSAASVKCAVQFDRQTIMDATHVMRHTLLERVAGDVALVRVHHARDRFVRRLCSHLSKPYGRVAVPTAGARLPVDDDDDAAADGSTNTRIATGAVGGDSAAVAVHSVDVSSALVRSPSSSPSRGGASMAAAPAVGFRLELENATLTAMPLLRMEEMLDAAVDAVAGLLRAGAPPSQAHDDDDDDDVVVAGGNAFADRATIMRGTAGAARLGGRPPADSVRCFHSAAIVAESLARRLRTVLVLFSTKRGPLARFNGDKLMLCFSPSAAPNVSEIAHALQSSIVAHETTVCRALLSEIATSLTQRLQTYLPNTRLVLDLSFLHRTDADPESALSALRVLTYKHSALVLQPFIEGACIGWDGPLGGLIRRSVRQLTLTLETGSCGTCYLASNGHAVYYCPLMYIQRAGRRLHGSLSTLPAWALLTGEQVASLLLLQIGAVPLARADAAHTDEAAQPLVFPDMTALVDTSKPAACWTELRRAGRGALVAGSRGRLRINVRNVLNGPVTLPDDSGQADEVRFKLVGDVSRVRVKDSGAGAYTVTFTAPRRAGFHNLYAFLHGRALLCSPLSLCVRPGSVALDRTRVVSSFNTVVAKRPFEVEMRLTDLYGNRLSRAPPSLSVTLHGASGGDAVLSGWSLRAPDRLVARLCAREATPEAAVQLQLSCSPSGDADGVQQAAVVVSFTVQCVERRVYDEVMELRNGRSAVRDADAPPTAALKYSTGEPSTSRLSAQQERAAEWARLYFRKAVRDADLARRRREAEAGGAGSQEQQSAYRFAPVVPRKRRGQHASRSLRTHTDE